MCCTARNAIFKNLLYLGILFQKVSYMLFVLQSNEGMQAITLVLES